MSQVTGSVISSVKDACRNGLLDWSPRLMLAMYSCEIQASSESCELSYAAEYTEMGYQLKSWGRCMVLLQNGAAGLLQRR